MKRVLISRIMSPFIEEYDKRYQDYLAKQTELLNEEYEKLSMKYHDGRINTAQHNFYSFQAHKIVGVYYATNFSWRVWTLKRKSGYNVVKPAPTNKSAGKFKSPNYKNTFILALPNIMFGKQSVKVNENMKKVILADLPRLESAMKNPKKSKLRK